MITIIRKYFKGNTLVALLSTSLICVALAWLATSQSQPSSKTEQVRVTDYASLSTVSSDDVRLGESKVDGIFFSKQSIPVANPEPPTEAIPMPQTTLFGMGAGTFGQLGNGTVVDSNASLQIGPASQWGTLVEVGLQTALVTDSSGGLWATGSDSTGAFGDGATVNTTNQFTELSRPNIKSIAVGDGHTLIITDDGQVYGTGAGALGQLGNGGTNANAYSTIMANGYKVVAYGNTSFVITTSGELWGFGENQSGQLGTGDTGNRMNPVQVDPAGVVDVSTSSTHTLYLMDDGAVFAMGNNDNGQFGNGTTTGSLSPIMVLPAGVKQIAAGDGFSLFRMDDDVLQGSGLNDFGQLGTGDKLVQTSLFQIANNVVDMDAGIGHTMFIKNDLTLWAIGKNENGQLGLDDFIDRLTPTQVTTSGQVTDVRASYNNTFYQQRTLNNLNIVGLWKAIEGDKVNLECEAHWSDGVVTNVTAEATWTDDVGFASFQQNTGVLQVDPGTSGNSINVSASYLGSQVGYTVNVGSPETGAALFGQGANGSGQLGIGTTADALSEVQIDSNKVIAMAGGENHSIYIREDGSVWAMGDNTYGQLGTGDNSPRTTATQILSGGAAEVGAGDFHSLVVMRDGSLWATGRNDEGQLGDGTFDDRNTLTKIVHSGVRRASGGGAHSIFLLDFGSLWTMGRGVEGQLGTGDTSGRNTPFLAVASNVNNLRAGKNHTIYQDQSGGLWGMGDNSVGQLGVGAVPTTQLDPTNLVATGVNEIAAAGMNTYYITTSGDLYFTGNNDFGQLGNNDPGVNVYTFTKLIGYSNLQVAAAGANFTIFIDGTGQMFGMGDYNNGQLGQGTTGTTAVPITMSPTNVNNGGFGSKHILFTKSQPTNIKISGLTDVYENEEAQYKCFLEYDNGQLEDITASATWGVNNANTSISASGRLFIDPATDGQQVTISANYNSYSDTLVANITALNSNFGDLRGLGANDSYQLGDNLDTTAHLTPITVDTDVVSVASGSYHTMYVKKDGSLWATGDNASGQLGTGDFSPRQSPVMVVAADVIVVDCGINYTMFVKNDGSLWAMGDMTDGKLGNNLFAGQLNTPVMVKDAGVVGVRCGFNHTLFFCSDGSLWGMGRNSNGQLGLSTSEFTTVGIPEKIIPDGVEKIAAGNFHSLFIRYGGLYGMGYNNDGQLGIGSTSTIVEAPVEVVPSGIRDVSANANFSLFLRNDNTLLGMGDNSSGQLGQGHTVVRISPVVIENNVKDISAGNNFSVWTTQSNVVRSCGANDFGQTGTGFVSGSETSPVTTDSGPAYQPGAGGYQTFFLIPSLVSIQISGPTSVNEQDSIAYTATANWSDSSTTDVSSTTAWGIDTGGSFAANTLTTADVAGDTPALITANYSGKVDTLGITILDAGSVSVSLTSDQSFIGEVTGVATLTATLSAVAAQDVVVDLGYSGVASAGTDFTAPASVTILAGNTSADITLNAIDDSTHEGDESVVIDITNVTNAIEDGVQQQVVTISDDDPEPTVTLSVSNAVISEVGGASNITVTLSGANSQDVTVDLGYSGTASLGTDYTAPASITILAGNTSASLALNATNDAVHEGDEAAVIDIINVTNATESGTQQRNVIITDDDPIPTVTLTVDQSSVPELSGVSTLTATLSGPTTSNVTVDLGYSGTASLGTDYNAPGSITIPAGSTTGSGTLNTADDGDYEGDETAVIDITAVTNATENGTQQQTVTITDDETLPTVSMTVNASTISESGGWTFYTLTLSGPSAQIVNVELGYTGTAVFGTDYTSPVFFNIPAGVTTFTGTITASNDALYEGDETVVADIVSVTNATEDGTQQATVTIIDDETIPTVTLTTSLSSISEVSGSATIIATLDSESTQDVTVSLGFTGTATNGTDYTSVSSMTIPAGTTTANASLIAFDDAVNEGDETVIIDITSVIGATENGTQQQVVTITDNDPIPSVTLTVSNSLISENAGASTITVTLSGPTFQDVTVDLGYTGTATLGTDYTAPASITVLAGNTSANVALNATDDAINEGNEAAVIDIINVVNATESGTQQRNVTITDDDPIPTVDLTVDLPSITEVSGVATLTATLSGETTQDVTVDLGYGGSANLGADYNAPASITILAGNTFANATLNATDDAVFEGDETAVVDITAVSNATENGTQQVAVTITDDETLPTVILTVDLPNINEVSGVATLTATLSGESTQNITVDLGYTGSASLGTDYNAPASITVFAGTTSAIATINALNDAVNEGDETVVVDITNVTNGTENGTQQQVVTITDDDPTPTVTLTVDVTSIGEVSGVALLTATLSGETTQDVTVDLNYTGAALLGTDYSAPASITILAGNTSADATVNTINDAVSEGNESIIVDITNVTNAIENGVQQQTLSIVDDEGTVLVDLSVNLSSIGELSGSAIITATLSSVSAQDVTVDLGYTGSATLGTDFSAPASITVLAGNTTGTGVINTIDDSVFESDEDIVIDITTVTNATENGTQQQIVTITENDLIPDVTLSADLSSIGELSGVSTLTATLSGIAAEDVIVDLSYTGTATLGTDFTAPATITVLAGNTTGNATLNSIDDAVYEGDETAVVDITNVTNGVENGTQQQVITITENEPLPTVTLSVDTAFITELSGVATITATLSGTSTQDVTVDLGYTGTAILGTDYNAPASITITAGSTTGNAVLNTINDAVNEGDETAVIDIVTVTGATESGTQQQTVTITDDDPVPTVNLTVDLPSISEASGIATITATLSGETTQDVTVNLGYSGAALLATDFTAPTALTITAGSTTASGSLTTIDDVINEGDETVTIDITTVLNATENGTQQQTVTITDDETLPTVSMTVNASTISESGGWTFYTLTLSGPSAQIVNVELGYTGTAVFGTDYTSPVFFNIPAGVTTFTGTITASNDALYEGNETVVADIVNVTNATESGTQQATVTIIDDEAVPTVTLTVGQSFIGETSGMTTVTATLSGVTTQDVTVDLGYTGTATQGTDYTGPASIVVLAGSTTGNVTLNTIDDSVYEGDETAVIDIINVTNATENGTQQQTVTITDDETLPTVSLSTSASTTNELGGSIFYTLTLSGESSQIVNVELGYTGTATFGTDYTSPVFFNIPAGTTVFNGTLTVTNDSVYEGNETIIADIVNVTNATESGTQQQIVTIIDDEPFPTVNLTVDLPTIGELSGTATLTATLSGITTQNVTVNLGYTGSATLGTDFTSPASITILAGSTTGTATFNAIDDAINEGNETAVIDIVSVTNANENGTQQQAITISDDDPVPTVNLTVDLPSISEVSGVATLTATLSGITTQDVTVDLGYAGSASFGTDYSASTSITILAGNATGSTTVNAIDDVINEGDETVVVDITNVTNATESGTQQQTVTITDDDPIPTVTLTTDLTSIGEISGSAILTATLSGVTTQNVTVDLGYTGTATLSTDYTAAASITILAGSTTGTTVLSSINDAVSEGDETVIVDITNVTNATESGTQQEIITIVDDEGTVVVDLTVDLPSITEVSGVATLTATLSTVSGSDVTVNLGYTGTASSGIDYTAGASITVLAGNTTGTATITAIDDAVYEGNEFVVVDITGVTNAVENGTQQQTVTITEDDAIPNVTLSVDLPTISEVSGIATLTATLSGTTAQNVTVDLGYTGTASFGTDYTGAGSITILAGNTTGTATVNASDDVIHEGDETVVVDVTNVLNAIENGTQQQIITITDDDPVPTVDLTVDLPTIGELSGLATLTATLSGVTTQDVTVDLGYTGTATSGTDYAAGTSITILAGATTGTAPVSAVDDAIFEGDETVVVDITTVTNATENGTQQQTVTITDDEGAVVVDLTVDLPSINEAGGLATLTASLSTASAQPITVDLGYTGTATSGTDYSAPVSITIPAGNISGTAIISAVSDAIFEGDETVIVDITTVTNATENGTQQQTVTITDDDPAPTVTLTVDSPSIGELSGVATLTATLSGVTTQNVTIDLGYTGTATSGIDYSGTTPITILAGGTTGTATITAIDDANYEGDETVIVDITNVINATESGTQQQTVTITENETVPTVTLTVDLPSITEVSGVAILTATLSGTTTQDVTVDLGYTGTATSTVDYSALNSITILAGNTTETAVVSAIDDVVNEGDETVIVDITNVTNATESGTQQQTVTITDDDPVPTVDLTVDLPSISELSGVATLTATLSGITTQDVTVDLGYTGTALSGTDYSASLSIIVLAGSTTGTATISAIDDAVSEGDETVIVDITNVTNATENGTQQQTVTITDDEGVPTVTLTVDLPSIGEPSGVATLTATLSGVSVQDVTVDLGYTGTATSGTDYTGTASISILAGSTTGTATVTAIDDAVYEGDETVVVDITTVTNAAEDGVQQQTVTITDDEPIPTVTLSVDLPSISELSGMATLTATLSGVTAQDVTVDLGYTGTATDTIDYSSLASITILAGNTTGTAAITAIDDATFEGDETVVVDITNVTNATESGTQQQTVTITDDDPPPVTVVSIAVTGPILVYEGTATPYTATATWSDSSTSDVSALATWSIDTSGTFSINTLNAALVAADTAAVITADYGGQSGTLNITVADIVVTSIEIQGPGAVAENDTALYSCIATYTDASTSDVTGSTIFSVSNTGTFTGNSLATTSVLTDAVATITATYTTFTDTLPITIFNVPGTLTGIRVIGPITVDENTIAGFQCVADFSDGTSVDVTGAATWTQTSQYATIGTTDGVFSATEVIGDWPSLVTASYGGFNNNRPTRILDLDPMAMIYVNKNASGVNNGTSWADAFSELRDAMPKAGPGTEIWVAAGAYTPYAGNNRHRTFQMTNGMKLYGGFDATETLASQRDPIANVTILSGDIGRIGIHNDNCYHVVVGANGATIDGFTIRDGRAYFTPPPSFSADSPETEGTDAGVTVVDDLEERQPEFVPDYFNFNDVGAGIVNDTVTVAIRNCKFINNSALYGGGAIYNQANTTLIEDCEFVSNRTEKWGGAIFNTQNATPTITRSNFLNNRANVSGGVMMNSAGASPNVSYCQFRQNSAGRDGGACINNFSNASFVNCVFWSNSAFDHAGAVINNDSSTQFNHCTFAANQASVSGGAFESNNSTVSLTNSIIWGNQSMQFQAFNARWGATHNLSHCVVDDPGLSGTNLVFADPVFTDILTGTLTLDPTSSAIDAGLNIGVADDIVGTNRGGTPDIGAYEYNGVPVPPGGGGGGGGGGDTGGSRSGGGGCALGAAAPGSILPIMLVLMGILGIRRRRRR